MVYIKYLSADMLCFREKVPEMPEKSVKNPFAFRGKSAYNGKCTLVSLT